MESKRARQDSVWLQPRRYQDRYEGGGKIAVMFDTQHTYFIGNDLSVLDTHYKKGLRRIQLAYNRSSNLSRAMIQAFVRRSNRIFLPSRAGLAGQTSLSAHCGRSADWTSRPAILATGRQQQHRHYYCHLLNLTLLSFPCSDSWSYFTNSISPGRQVFSYQASSGP